MEKLSVSTLAKRVSFQRNLRNSLALLDQVVRSQSQLEIQHSRYFEYYEKFISSNLYNTTTSSRIITLGWKRRLPQTLLQLYQLSSSSWLSQTAALYSISSMQEVEDHRLWKRTDYRWRRGKNGCEGSAKGE